MARNLEPLPFARQKVFFLGFATWGRFCEFAVGAASWFARWSAWALVCASGCACVCAVGRARVSAWLVCVCAGARSRVCLGACLRECAFARSLYGLLFARVAVCPSLCLGVCMFERAREVLRSRVCRMCVCVLFARQLVNLLWCYFARLSVWAVVRWGPRQEEMTTKSSQVATLEKMYLSPNER